MASEQESEKAWFDRTRMRLQQIACRLFRNNVGMSKFTDEKTGKSYWVKYGLHDGSSDLIGWTTVVVTDEMVGTRIAVFTSLEGKRGKDQVTEQQYRWIRAVAESGGIAGIFTTDESAQLLVEEVVRIIRAGGTNERTGEQSMH